jgi:hypothetical protein
MFYPKPQYDAPIYIPRERTKLGVNASTANRKAKLKARTDIEWLIESCIDQTIYDATVEIVDEQTYRKHLNWQPGGFYSGEKFGAVIWGYCPLTRSKVVSQVKLSHPLKDDRGKVRKYETPKLGKGSQRGIFALPDCLEANGWQLWQQVANRAETTICCPIQKPDRINGDGKYDYYHFWDWVQDNPQVDSAILEGAKKTFCALTQGIVAIGLTGVTLGRLKDANDQVIGLQPWLDQFATPGRTIKIIFDADAKLKTRYNVGLAAYRLGFQFEHKRCKVLFPELPLLDGEKCGFDDFIAAKGFAEFVPIDSQAIGLVEKYSRVMRDKSQRERVLSPDIKEFCNPLMTLSQSELALPPDLIAGNAYLLRSPMASAKTKSVTARALAIQATDPEIRIIVVTPTRALTANAANRIGGEIYTELETYRNGDCKRDRGGKIPKRVAACYHSLHRLMRDIHAWGWKPEKTIVIVDESEQVFAGLETTSLIKNERGSILKAVKALIQHCLEIWCLDANLSSLTAKWVKKYRQGNVTGMINNYVPIGYQLNLLHNGEIVDTLGDRHYKPLPFSQFLKFVQELLNQGKKIILPTDSIAISEKLFKLLHCQGKKVLINRKTTNDPEQKRLLANINQVSQAYDLIIHSPSIGNGVSIEHDGFDAVCCYLTGGSITPIDVLQMLKRYRPNVDRYVRMPFNSRPNIRNNEFGSHTDPAKIKVHWQTNLIEASQSFELAAKSLGRSIRPDINESLDPDSIQWRFEHDQHIDWICEIEADRHVQMLNFGWQLLSNADLQGNSINFIQLETDQSAERNCKQLCDALTDIDIEAVQAIEKLPESEYYQLLDNTEPTAQQQLQAKANGIMHFYDRDHLAGDTGKQLIIDDDNGQLQRQISRLQRMLDDSGLAIKQDLNKLDQQVQLSDEILPQDIPTRALEADYLLEIGIKAIALEMFKHPDRLWTNLDFTELEHIAWNDKKRFERIINFKLTDRKHQNGKYIARYILTTKLGFKLKSERIRVKGIQVHAFKPDRDRLELLENTLAHQDRKAENLTCKALIPAPNIQPAIDLTQTQAQPDLEPELTPSISISKNGGVDSPNHNDRLWQKSLPEELAKLRSRLAELAKLSDLPQADAAEIELAKKLTRAIATEPPINVLKRAINFLAGIMPFDSASAIWTQLQPQIQNKLISMV